MKNIVLVGQAPSRTGDMREPLGGRIGARLARLVGLSQREYLDAFERRNVFGRWLGKNGKGDLFPQVLASAVADKMKPLLRGRRVIFLGRATARAFGFVEDFFRWKRFDRFSAAVFPHPSGINRWWNDQRNVRRAARFLRKEPIGR